MNLDAFSLWAPARPVTSPTARKRWYAKGALPAVLLCLTSAPACALADAVDALAAARRIKATYEQSLFMLSPYRMGHYGVRLFRQTQDPRYASLIRIDLLHRADRLNAISATLDTPADFAAAVSRRLAAYRQRTGPRARRRLLAVQSRPDYLVTGSRLLAAMAWVDAYGLRHRDDARLRELLRGHDFADTVTDPAMIRAWAAPLANQVFWLRQLGEIDLVDTFIDAFRAAYPDGLDPSLPDQEYHNKLYGLTHILLAASGYYRLPVAEASYQWVFDHLRRNADEIERRATLDILAEVGLCFLLAGLDEEPFLRRIRSRVAAAVSAEHGMLLTRGGMADLQRAGHRNTMAVLLLDWRGPHAVPTVGTHPELFVRLPFGLEAKPAASAIPDSRGAAP